MCQPNGVAELDNLQPFLVQYPTNVCFHLFCKSTISHQTNPSFLRKKNEKRFSPSWPPAAWSFGDPYTLERRRMTAARPFSTARRTTFSASALLWWYTCRARCGTEADGGPYNTIRQGKGIDVSLSKLLVTMKPVSHIRHRGSRLQQNIS